MFLELQDKLKDYNFLYTDGSLVDGNATYSITNLNKIIKISNLPHFTSIFSAEIIAIFEAIKLIKNSRDKHVICSDSLSALDAIANVVNNDYYISQIRNILIDKYPNIILVWIPGHVHISGNEFADHAAKHAQLAPLISTENFNFTDINKFIKKKFHIKFQSLWNTSNSWYRQINLNKSNFKLYAMENHDNINRLDTIKFIRLRLGHSKLTHGHLMTNSLPSICPCNQQINVNLSHILQDCPLTARLKNSIFKNINPLSILSSPSNKSIALIIKFLKFSNLYHYI